MFYSTRRKQRDLTESRVARFEYPVIKRCLLYVSDLNLSPTAPSQAGLAHLKPASPTWMPRGCWRSSRDDRTARACLMILMPLAISLPSVRACCESGRTSASDEPRDLIGQHPTRTILVTMRRQMSRRRRRVTNGAPPHTLPRARPTIEEVASAVVLVGAFGVVRCHAPTLSFSRAKRDSEPRGGGQGAWLDAASLSDTHPLEIRAACGCARPRAGTTVSNRHPICMCSLTLVNAPSNPPCGGGLVYY